MEEELANLNIVVDEEEPVQAFDGEDYAEEDFNFCLVGRVLTDNIFHFPSMRNLLAELWHSIERISITKIEDKRILFRFYNKVDLHRVWDVYNLSLGLMPEGFSKVVWKFYRARARRKFLSKSCNFEVIGSSIWVGYFFKSPTDEGNNNY
ncbi:hypothetical protein Gotur_023118 [Gossypium turneri]